MAEFSYLSESKKISSGRLFSAGGSIAIMLLMIIPLVHFIDFLRIDMFRNVWGPTEFLINYEGGFVRRGLIGEGLYLLSRATELNPLLIINFFCTLCYVSVSVLFLRRFREEGWKWWLVFSIYLCGYTSCIIRKDYMLFLIIFGIFYLLKKFQINRYQPKDNKAKPSYIPVICGLFILVIFAMLSHEAFIFFGTVPGCLYLWRVKRRPLLASIFASVSVLMFILAVAFHGTPAISNLITEEWNKLGTMPAIPTKGAIRALGWEISSTFKYHLTNNMLPPGHLLWHRGLLTHILGFLTWVAKFILAYYVLANYPAVFSRKGSEADRLEIRDRIGGLLLLTWIFMLPMFTVLCCELSRTHQLWAMGVFIPAAMISRAELVKMVPDRFAYLSKKINTVLTRFIPPRREIILILILLLLFSLNFTIINSGTIHYSVLE